jgi:small-conductance mechanosensitive channel
MGSNRNRARPRRGSRRSSRLQPPRRAVRRPSRLAGRAVGSARRRLRGFRYASVLAVALTGLLLLLFAPTEATAPVDLIEAQEGPEASAADTPERPADIEELVPQTAGELRTAIDNVVSGFLRNLPKFIVAALILLLAWALARLLRWLVRRLSKHWERGDAIGVLIMAGFWLLAIGLVISVIAGDLRALVGSLGLVGLALSWALQTPIESFTGWLLNSFKGYYRVGDRIAVGEIFGDVYRIDVLTTTIWEIGSPDRPATQVHAEQPTGRLITFPNNEILTGTVVNLTKDFPYVWNELEFMLAAETDVDYALAVLGHLADDVLKEQMREPAMRYETILKARGLEASVPRRPQLYVALVDDGLSVTVRYLVDARQRRINQSELVRRIFAELQKTEHAGRIVGYHPRRLMQVIDEQGRPVPVGPGTDSSAGTV